MAASSQSHWYTATKLFFTFFMTILAGRNDYSWFLEEGTEAVSSCDLSKATKLEHGRSPLSSMPQLLSDNISSLIKWLSLRFYSSFVFKNHSLYQVLG